MALPVQIKAGPESALLPGTEDTRLWALRFQAALLTTRLSLGAAWALPVGVSYGAGGRRLFRPIVDAVAARNLVCLLVLAGFAFRRLRPRHRVMEGNRRGGEQQDA